ncbi:MAG: hypothetical protein GY759_00380 [Chloroflexi bacterium]|nr:hypothetical protein [Chloroflexota bacterium]
MKTKQFENITIRLIMLLLVAQLALQIVPMAQPLTQDNLTPVQENGYSAMRLAEDCGGTTC